ncbi:hypothetical protein CEP53_014073 [Fusarium sp. AF-6]|nr:hypothetical protein CEP53_014073 [Fusarium sp. AF-6]
MPLVGFIYLAYTKLEYAIEAFNIADDDDEINDLKSIVLEAVQDGLKCKRNLLDSLLGTVFLVDDLPKDVRDALQLTFKTPFPSLTPSSSPSTSTVQTTTSSAGKHERGPIVQDDGTHDYSDQDLETDVADHDIEMTKSNGTILETTDSIAVSFFDAQTVPDPAQRHERTRTYNKERTQDDFPDQVTEPSDDVEMTVHLLIEGQESLLVDEDDNAEDAPDQELEPYDVVAMVESNDAIQTVAVAAERPENRPIDEDDDTQDGSANQDHEADDVDDAVEIIESYDAVRETTGYIRVGRQPIQSHNPAVRTAPFFEVRCIISDRLNRLYKCVDIKLGTLAQAKLDSNFRDMEQLLLGSFAAHPNETSSRLCDYTGLPLFWSPGPFSISVEAVYLYASSDGQLGYHTPTNMALIMSFLNFVKKTQPPLVLPLLGAWQRSLAHPDFQERRSLCAWVFNAMTNTAILHKLFGGTLSHQRQISLWSQWEYDKLREVLQLLRAGEVTQTLTDADTDLTDLDAVPFDRTSWRTRDTTPGAHVHGNMILIAAKYGVAKSEFDYYFTLPAPNKQDRVFYPYHIPSRPRSEALS